MRKIVGGDYRQIVVQLPDGTTKRGTVGPDGRLYIEVDPPQGNQQGGNGPGQGEAETYRRSFGTLPDIPKDLTFQQKLASILKDNAYHRITRNLKRGKLDMKRLWKVGTHTENVFKAKTDRRGKNYNVVLVIDESGSMNGAPIQQAAMVAAFLTDNFQSLKIDLSVIGYANSTKIRKSFEETVAAQVVQKRIIGNFMGGGTNDHQALIEAYKMCKDRDGESLVIVITDGDGMPSEVLRPLIAKNETVAKTFAIGIDADTPGYPQGIRAKDLDELKPMVLNIIKSQVHRG